MKGPGRLRESARVGVISDTHVGELLPRMPLAVLDALTGVDLILHAGDITEPGALDALRDLAPVVAVQGNHDRDAGVELPRTAVVEVAGVTIGVVHGDRSRAVELLAGTLSLASGRVRTLGLCRSLVRAIGEVDVLVFGHIHHPIQRWVGDTLVFCAGAVYQPEIDPGFEWTAPAARALGHFRRRLPAEMRCPSVGVLDIVEGGARPRIVRLPQPLLPTALAANHCHHPEP